MLFELRVEAITQGGGKGGWGEWGQVWTRDPLCDTSGLNPPNQSPLSPAPLLTKRPTSMNQSEEPGCKEESTDASSRTSLPTVVNLRIHPHKSPAPCSPARAAQRVRPPRSAVRYHFFLSCLWTFSQFKWRQWSWIMMRCFPPPRTVTVWTSPTIFFLLSSEELSCHLGHGMDTYGYQRKQRISIFLFLFLFFLAPVSPGIITQLLCFLWNTFCENIELCWYIGCRAKGEIDERVSNWCKKNFSGKLILYFSQRYDQMLNQLVSLSVCLSLHLPLSVLFSLTHTRACALETI